MQMNAGDIGTYPKFKQYVSIAIPKLVDAPTIISAIHKYAGIIDEAKNKFSARQSREVLSRNFYFSLFP